MKRIVMVTRHPDGCRELQALVRPCDITIKPYPVLRLEESNDEEGWQAALQRLGPGHPASAWLILASPRAPKRLVAQAGQRHAAHLLELPAAAVGPTTAAAARDAGLRVQLVGSGTGADLAEDLLPALEPASTILFACGHERRRELPEKLEAAGHTVVSVVVYRMRPTPPREMPPLGPRVDVVVLTSPRAARLYLDSVGGLPLPCDHVALGPTTQQAAGAMGIDCRIPEQPNIPSLAEELCRR